MDFSGFELGQPKQKTSTLTTRPPTTTDLISKKMFSSATVNNVCLPIHSSYFTTVLTGINAIKLFLM